MEKQSRPPRFVGGRPQLEVRELEDKVRELEKQLDEVRERERVVIAEFNAGYEHAQKPNASIMDEPETLEDNWRNGFMAGAWRAQNEQPNKQPEPPSNADALGVAQQIIDLHIRTHSAIAQTLCEIANRDPNRFTV